MVVLQKAGLLFRSRAKVNVKSKITNPAKCFLWEFLSFCNKKVGFKNKSNRIVFIYNVLL